MFATLSLRESFRNFFYFSLLLSTSVFIAFAANAADPEDARITLDANGVPLQIPVWTEQRVVKIVEDPKAKPDEPTESFHSLGGSARLFFGFEHYETDRKAPYRYRAVLQYAKDSEIELPPIPTRQLKTLFQRAPLGTQSTFSVEMDSGMWAPSSYQTFVVDATTENARYYAGVKVVRLVQDDLTSKPFFITRPLQIPLSEVEDRILPMSKAFLSIPDRPEEQVYYVHTEGDEPVAVSVLGFQNHPAEQGIDLHVAYVTPRRSLERQDQDLRVYRIPFGLLRTTLETRHKQLLAKMRSSNQPYPEWLELFRYPLSISRKDRSFTEAFRELRTGLNSNLSKAELMPPLIYGTACKGWILAAAS